MNETRRTKNEPEEVELNWVGEIKGDTLLRIMEEIQRALKKNKETTFRMNLFSGGGGVEVSLAFYQWIKLNKIKLTIVGLSMIASSATIVFLSGSKRQCNPETIFLFHHISVALDKTIGPYEFEENLKLNKLQNKRYRAIYKKMGFSKRELAKIMREGMFLSAKEAKERGIVHEIIEI